MRKSAQKSRASCNSGLSIYYQEIDTCACYNHERTIIRSSDENERTRKMV